MGEWSTQDDFYPMGEWVPPADYLLQDRVLPESLVSSSESAAPDESLHRWAQQSYTELTVRNYVNVGVQLSGHPINLDEVDIGEADLDFDPDAATTRPSAGSSEGQLGVGSF